MRLDWQLRVAPDDILDFGPEAKSRVEVVAVGMFRDLSREHRLPSFLGLNIWHVFLTLRMCLLLGSVFFKNVWDQAYVVVTLPHYCLTLDFNPLFYYLEQYLFIYVCVN